jgi:small subunit ribosomal protein S1
VFVELEPGLEGLLHISELADHKVDSPEDVVKVGDEVEVKILRVDAADRKIGLSRKRLHDGIGEEEGGEPTPAAPTPSPTRPRERELRGGTGSGSGQLINVPEPPK